MGQGRQGERQGALAVEKGIPCVNVESEGELELLSSIAAGKGREVHVLLLVKVPRSRHALVDLE